MPERPVTVSLETTGVAPSHVPSTFDEFTQGQRFRRAGAILGVAWGLAIVILFIPIVHLLGVPLLFVAGIVLAIRQLTFAGRLEATRVPCPKCGAVNRIGGGLGRRSLKPRDYTCDSCRRGLTLRIEPQGGAS